MNRALVVVPALLLFMTVCLVKAETSESAVTRLPACPPTPNCVSSLAAAADQRVEPIAYAGSVEQAAARIREAVSALARARMVKEDGPYLRAEFTSAVFRFVDDVEFLIDRDAHLIHVRSASRVGRYDFGVNRRRVERLRALLEARK